MNHVEADAHPAVHCAGRIQKELQNIFGWSPGCQTLVPWMVRTVIEPMLFDLWRDATEDRDPK